MFKIDFDSQCQNILVHMGQEEPLDFNMGVVYKRAKISYQEVFPLMNRYVSEKLEYNDHVDLFDLYLQAKDLFQSSNYLEKVDSTLLTIFDKIVNIIDLDKLQQFVVYEGAVTIPDNVKSNFGAVQDMFSRNKTYLRDEYLELVTLSVALRFIFPLWAEYLEYIIGTVPDSSKELRAYGLLRKCKIAKLDSITRLLSYIGDWIKPNIKTTGSTVSGVGREEIPEWVCSLILVRRLCVVELIGPEVNIIRRVHSYVDDAVKNIDKRFDERINPKHPPKESKSGENPSYLESYRTKTQITTDTIELHNVYLSDILGAVRDFIPNVNPQLVQEVLKVTDGLENAYLSETNTKLVQWLLANIQTPYILPDLEKQTVVRGMIVGQCICHYYGLNNLALMFTGIDLPKSKDTIMDQWKSLSPEVIAQFEKIYPYERIPKRNERRNQPTNYGISAINELAIQLGRYRKAVRVPAFLSIEDVKVDKTGYMYTPKDIIVELAQLLINLDQTFEQDEPQC